MRRTLVELATDFMSSLWRRYRSRARAIFATGLTLAGWLLGPVLPAHAAQTVSVGVLVHILNPPNAVTDLTASAVGSNSGDVQLVWTAPSNANGAAIDHYVVRIATFPAPAPALGETWWSALGLSQRTVAPAHAPGVSEFSVISGLTVGVTQYFGIKAVDVDGEISPIDLRVGTLQQAASLPLNLGPPGTPSSLTGVAQSTGSVLWQWSSAAGATFYDLRAAPGGALIAQTALLQVIETGLTPNSAATRTVSAGNLGGQSSPTGAVTVYTLAATPSTPTITQLGVTGVTIGWNANGNPAGTVYRVERSLDNVTFTPLTPQVTATAFTDSGLQPLTSYYYRIAARNGDGILSGPSATLAIFTPPDRLPPRAPMGLQGVVSSPNFFLSWDPVTLNADGTPISDLAGYHVYRSTAAGGPRVRLTTFPVTVPVFADRTNDQTFFYVIHAVDSHGNESDDSLTADSSENANVIFLAGDGLSSVRMPKDINEVLRSEHNKYGVPLSITLVEEPLVSDNTVVRDVRLQIVRGDTLAPVDDVSFPAAHATVSLGYSVVAGEVGRGAPSQAAVQAAGVTPQQLSLYWNNGVSWIHLGGVLDLPTQTVAVRTAFLGHYELRSTAPSTSLHLDKSNVYPRIITPNGDGLNDRVYFVLENPNNASVRGEILDKDGRHVATLPDPSTVSGIGTTLIWDGTDGNGNVVPGGAYIYKIQGDGQTFTGTVGVAR